MMHKNVTILLTALCLMGSASCSRKAKSATKKKKAESSDAAAKGSTGTGSDTESALGANYTKDTTDIYTSTYTSPNTYGNNGLNNGFTGLNNGPTSSPNPLNQANLDSTQVVLKLGGAAASPTSLDRIVVTWSKLKDVADGATASYTASFTATGIKGNKIPLKPSISIKYRNKLAKACEIAAADITPTASQPQSARCEG